MFSVTERLSSRLGAAVLGGLFLAASASAEGDFTNPRRGETLAAGETVEVRWSGACDDARDRSESELLLSLDGGLTFPVRLTPEMSMCARGFRWEVPALETAHARLALRTGSGEESENERLEVVSDEFQIVAVEDGDDADLFPGARELWTRQALDGDGAEDLPFESFGRASESLVIPAASPDINEPTPSSLATPGLSSTASARDLRREPAATAPPDAKRSIVPLPLRL